MQPVRSVQKQAKKKAKKEAEREAEQEVVEGLDGVECRGRGRGYKRLKLSCGTANNDTGHDGSRDEFRNDSNTDGGGRSNNCRSGTGGSSGTCRTGDGVLGDAGNGGGGGGVGGDGACGDGAPPFRGLTVRTRFSREVGRMERFDTYCARRLAPSRRGNIFVDGVVHSFVKRDHMIALLRQHIFCTVLFHRNRYYRLREGIPQVRFYRIEIPN